MKPLSEGNYALCIAHPGHELRLHGFLEQAKPFVFILTDGSHRTQQDMMMDSIRSIDRAVKQNVKLSIAYLQSAKSKKIFKLCDHSAAPDEQHLKDTQIYSEILSLHTGIFHAFIKAISTNLIKYKITHVVADSSEGYNVCHEIVRIMTDIAIEQVKKKTGQTILSYDYAIEKPYNEGITEDCIHVQLDEMQLDRKMNAILKYPFALTDLKPNISMDNTVMLQLRQMKDGNKVIKEMMQEVNSDFLKNEYLRPYIVTEPKDKPIYETMGEKAVAAEKYPAVITYAEHLKPLKEKLRQELFQISSVS